MSIFLSQYLSDQVDNQNISVNRRFNPSLQRDVVNDTNGQVSSEFLHRTRHLYNIVTGYISDVTPFMHCYRVNIPGYAAPIMCSTLQTGGANSQAFYDSSTYTCGTNVIVAANPVSYRGVILGAVTEHKDRSCRDLRGFIDSATRFMGDPSDLGILNHEVWRGELHEFSHGKTLDMTDIGEFCKRACTGMQMFLDPFMAIVAANDYTGLWVFEQDYLTRLSGLNLQIRSSGFEKEYLNDTGEYIEYEGSTLYPWESLGRLKKPGGELIREIPREEWLEHGATIGYVEPHDEQDAQPFHRIVTLGGWLGQGKQTSILLPPKDKEWFKFGEQETVPCLSRVTQSVDGLVSLESSKGILITKRGMFPGSHRVERPDEPFEQTGDNESNYDFKHDKQTLPKDMQDTGEYPCLTRATSLPDYIGYNVNWKNVFPAAYHKKDYYIEEESKLEHGSCFTPKFNSLKSNQYLKDDHSYKLDIDEKRKSQEFHETEAGIALLPEGGVVIYDGYGGEIRMAGGSITISAPGDISIKPGRSAHIWSGKDTVIRANKNVDVSATKNAVRVKAEKHLELLGGNSGTGSVIIESRGRGYNYDFDKVGDEAVAAGIILKAGNSAVAAEGSRISLRSGATGPGAGIYLDAKQGSDTVYVFSSDVREYVKQDHTINFVSGSPSDVDVTTRFSKSSTEVNGNLTVPGFLGVKDMIIAGSTVITTDVYVSGKSELVAKDSKNLPKYSKILDELMEIPEEKLPEINEKMYEAVDQQIYKQKKVGNSTVLEKTGFSFRDENQYDAPQDFTVYEDRWQTFVTNSSGSSEKWEEKPVIASDKPTYPFPGKKYYEETQCYVMPEFRIADLQENRYKNRMSDEEPSDPYKDPKFGKPQKDTLNSYKIL